MFAPMNWTCWQLLRQGYWPQMRVEVSGKLFVFPRQCACCGRFPGSRLTISGTERNRNSRTRGWLWDVPYCRDCVDHVRLTDSILIVGVSIAAVFGFCSFLITALGVDWRLSVATFLASSGGAGALVWLAIAQVRRRAHSGCCTVFRAVTYLGSAGATHAFDFHSKPYLRFFVRSNRLKLVNASAIVSQIVQDSPVSENQVARRLTKRLR